TTSPLTVTTTTNGYEVTGTTRPGATITVTNANGDPIKGTDGNPLTATVGTDGKIDFTIPKASVNPGDVVTVQPAGA
ncbi:Ig-like domain-containing protein, partial [Secundilactobacillus folii]|uniref:Ig-like domain-containing protein n=1 Tax=Secundilactobacillus folii TaxID=2678357 RepID=UPI001FEA783A